MQPDGIAGMMRRSPDALYQRQQCYGWMRPKAEKNAGFVPTLGAEGIKKALSS